jgi:hypothetical protein
MEDQRDDLIRAWARSQRRVNSWRRSTSELSTGVIGSPALLILPRPSLESNEAAVPVRLRFPGCAIGDGWASSVAWSAVYAS